MTHDYCEFEEYMQPHTQNPYPTWTADRGQEDPNPFVMEFVEVQTDPRIGLSKYHGSVVDVHRIEGQTLDPGRVLTHPSRIVAPVLIASNQPQTFDVPHYIIPWAPNPIVQRSFGQWTVAVDDTRHTIPKQLPDYSYNALSQQELADEAALRVRRALYGR
jgi:hypothetical protein